MTPHIKHTLGILSLPLLLAACQSTPGAPNAAAPQTKEVSGQAGLDALSPLALAPTSLTVGQTRQFDVTVGGQAPQPGQLVWTSSSSGVVNVTGGGLVTALTPGTATVRAALASNRNAFLEFPVTVLAATSAPVPTPASSFAQQVLELTNVARARGQNCGGTAYPPAPALTYNLQLEKAAQLHAADMAVNNYFSHESLDGRSFEQRVTASGYRWTQIAENIAAGQLTPADVVSGWLASPGHCQNLMNPDLRELGLGYAYNAASTYRSYWVQDFGHQ